MCCSRVPRVSSIDVCRGMSHRYGRVLPSLFVVVAGRSPVGDLRVVLLHEGHVGLLLERLPRVLLEVRYVMRGMAALEDCIQCRVLLRPLPQEMAAQRLCKLGSQHVATRSPGREHHLMGDAVCCGHDGKSSRALGNLVDGLHGRRTRTALHHQRSLIGIVGRDRGSVW